MSKDGVKTLFNVAALATNVLSERGEGSLIEFASSTQNIILVTVEDTLTHHAVTPEILKFCTNIYIGYYLQAVALLNTIGDVSVRQVLDRLKYKSQYQLKCERYCRMDRTRIILRLP